jgi:predicted permease
LFAADPDVIGRSVQISGVPFDVVGVMPPNFHGLGRRPDFWTPLSALSQIEPNSAGKEATTSLDVIARLRPGVSPAAATGAITAWIGASSAFDSETNRFRFAMLLPVETTTRDIMTGLVRFMPLFFAFGLVLLIGCANVASLLLARGLARQREIGIRLSLGASRQRIVRQLMTEGILLALAAAALGLAVTRLALEGGMRLLASTMGGMLADAFAFDVPATDWRVSLFVVAAALGSTVFFALMPALRSTRLELVNTMRGELIKDVHPRRSRRTLVAMQVGASALLLIAATTFLRSTLSAASASHGIRTADTVTVAIANEPLRPAILQALEGSPLVEAVAASLPGVPGNAGDASIEAAVSSEDVAGLFHEPYQLVSPTYFAVLGIDVLQGRGFSNTEIAADAGVVVLSESTAHKLWPDSPAVGRRVQLASKLSPGTTGQLHTDFTAGTFTVIGVVRDVVDDQRLRLFNSFDARGIYLPTSAATANTSLILRVTGDPDHARQALTDRLTDIDPALGAVTALHTVAGMGAFILRVVFWITAALGGLALALTLSGIFSVLSYIVEQRRHEIGVRMALGASMRDVMAWVVGQSVRPVGAGLLVGGTLAGAIAAALLSTRAASQIGRAVPITDPVSYAAGIGVIAVACLAATLVPALRAGRINPIDALRQD